MKMENIVFASEELMEYFVLNNDIKIWSFRYDSEGNVVLTYYKN